MKTLFENHINHIKDSTAKSILALNYDGLILGSGTTSFYFEDDMTLPFQTNPHFAHWCPAKGPHHFIKYTPGQKPLLVYYSPDDFWHIHERLNSPFWEDCFEIVEVNTKDDLWKNLGNIANYVFIGDEIKYAEASEIKVNCQFLTARLNWNRRRKSEYEIHCIEEANAMASKGHKAAKSAFFSGGSEYEIHMSYLNAIGVIDQDLPYPGIVGVDKNAAILHYHGREHKKDGHVLLIDSGASYLHYPADITRTYCQENTHSVFKDLLACTEALQKDLCDDVKIGAFFPDLHYKCHTLVAQSLHECGILQNVNVSDYNKLVDEGLTKAFLPHGLGHMLGVQVHDIGGKQIDENGNIAPKLDKKTTYKSLRYLGYLEENNVITIEPGIYLIPSLLKNISKHQYFNRVVNWELVEQLIPFGGIRIEDEVVPTKQGAYNITRKFLF